jgi:glutamyl-tRNA reductase
MGGLAAAALRRAGIGEIVFANRTIAHAERLAKAVVDEGIPAHAVDLGEIRERLVDTDLLIACTGAGVPTVTVADVLARPPAKPLVVCDLGLPRDVEPAAARLPGITMVDLTTLRGRLADAPAGREATRAAELVTTEVRRYLAARRSSAVTPTVTALRRRAAEVVDAELSRLDSRLPELDAAVREELARTVRRVVDKLLHAPTVRVKQLAAAPGGATYAEALRELFELDPTLPAVFSEPSVPGGQFNETRVGAPRPDGKIE